MLVPGAGSSSGQGQVQAGSTADEQELQELLELLGSLQIRVAGQQGAAFLLLQSVFGEQGQRGQQGQWVQGQQLQIFPGIRIIGYIRYILKV